jgi:hypothetical protein
MRLKDMTDSQRKATPVFDGLFAYFPNAIAMVARKSIQGQYQHGPTEDLQWHRERSTDELGSLTRHLLDYAIAEKEGDYITMADATEAIMWRALAHGERFFATTEEDPERYQFAERLRKGDTAACT